MEEDQLSRGNFLQPCLRALVRNVRDFYHGSRGQEEGGEGRSESGQQQPLVVDGGEEEAEEDQDQDQEEDVMAMGPGSGSGGTSSSGSDADKARELARYVDRFAALMERRFRALVLGRATAAPKAVPKADVGVVDGGGEEEDEEDGEGPVVVPWEEVARALGEIEAEGGVAAGGGGRELSTIAEEDVKE